MFYVSNLFEHNVTSVHHTDEENRGKEVTCVVIVEITVSGGCCHSMQVNLLLFHCHTFSYLLHSLADIYVRTLNPHYCVFVRASGFFFFFLLAEVVS